MASFDELWEEQIQPENTQSSSQQSAKTGSFEELWSQTAPKQRTFEEIINTPDLMVNELSKEERDSLTDEQNLELIKKGRVFGPSKRQQAKIMGSVMGGLVGAPKALTQFPGQVADWVQTLFTGEAGQDLPESIQPFFDSLKQVGDVLPSGEAIRGGVIRSELAGESPELAQETAQMPPDLLEKVLMGVQGGATLGGGVGGLVGGFQPVMEEGLEAVDASDRVKAAANLGLMGTGAFKIKEGLQFKPNEKPVGEFLKKQGLSDAQINTVLAGKKPNRLLNKLATKKGKTELILEGTKQGLESVYEGLRERPEAEIVLDRPARVEMEQSMNEILQDLPARDRTRIREDVQDFFNSPRTASDAINLYRDINATYGTRGRAGLRLKEPINEMLQKIDPEFANDFKMANEAYSSFANIRRELKPKEVSVITQAMLKKPGLSLLGTYLFGTPALGLKAAGLSYLIPRLSREMVLNPKLRNISRKLSSQLSRRSLGAANQTKNELAQEMSQIDPKLGELISETDLEEFFNE